MMGKNGNGDDSDDGLTFPAMRNENANTSGGTARGHVQWRGGRWWVRARGPDGRNRWYPLPRSLVRDDTETAKRVARQYAVRMERDGFRSESCDEYFDRLCTARQLAGITITGIQQERWTWRKWIGPCIGQRPIAEVTCGEIARLRHALDLQVCERQVAGLGAGIMGSTARRVWSVVRMVFTACSWRGRDPELRVRKDDPTIGVVPPLRTRPRASALLRPAEVQALLACEQVPLEWRLAYALGIYSYARLRELQAMTWANVDLAAKTMRIGTRRVPVDPVLQPLLCALHEAHRTDDAPVLPALKAADGGRLAARLREHLRTAGVTRSELFASNNERRRVRFYTFRETGMAWLANAGVPHDVVCRRAGRTPLAATNGLYVTAAEKPAVTSGEGHREPLPPIPDALIRDSGKQKDPAAASCPPSGDGKDAPRVARRRRATRRGPSTPRRRGGR